MEGMEGMKLQQLMERQPKRKVRTSSYLIDEANLAPSHFVLKMGLLTQKSAKASKWSIEKRTLSPAESGVERSQKTLRSMHYKSHNRSSLKTRV